MLKNKEKSVNIFIIWYQIKLIPWHFSQTISISKNIKKEEVIIIEKRLLNPKLDYVFKRIFGYSGNEDITKELISSIIEEEITNIELDKNPILEKDLLDEKLGILDIRTKINNSVNVNIVDSQVAMLSDPEYVLHGSPAHGNARKVVYNHKDGK